jgi:cyanate permease
LTAGGIAEAVAPWIVGHIRDVTGSYSNGFLFLIAMSLLGAVVVAFLPKQAVRA